MVRTETLEKLQLIDRQFIPSEALKIIEAMLDEEISLHKLRKLSAWIGDCNADTGTSEKRIEELHQEKQLAKKLARMAEINKVRLKVQASLEIDFSE
ncbi:hypothetical protein [Zeaxanthinibacter enoshimensis]|uniref:hypothetical protein n=1 Tax=Zeaxanthinibacter enoshimensis TaxID=392009 RepID=UPI00356A009A